MSRAARITRSSRWPIRGHREVLPQQSAALLVAGLSTEARLTIQRGFRLYRIENIGRAFNAKSRDQLQQTLNAAEQEGWEFHSVFSVSESTCMGQSSETLYMVLKRR